MEEYEVKLDVMVPWSKKIMAENEDAAIELVYKELERKGIAQERLENLKWKLLSKKKPS